MRNPYAGVGQIAFGPRFVRRPEPVEFLHSVWNGSRPGNASVTGNYRVGKSSIARNAAVEHSVSFPEHLVVVTSAGRVDGAISLLRVIGRRIYHLLQTTKQPAALQDSCKKCLTAAMEFEDWFGVSEAVADLFRLLCEAGLGVLIVVDEFDRVGPWFERAGFQFLRDLASEPEFSVGLTTVSRRSVYDIEVAGFGGSILGGVLSHVYNVGLLESTEGADLVGRGLSVSKEFASYVEELEWYAGLHPFLLDLACYWYVENLLGSAVPVVSRFRPQFNAVYSSYLVDLDNAFPGHSRAGAALLTAGRDLSSLGVTAYLLASSLVVREGHRRMWPFSQDFSEYWLHQRDGLTVAPDVGGALHGTA